MHGREVRLWGFVDHANMFGDESARRILKDWWGGEGPDAATWGFNLKAEPDDAPGHSFSVRIPNDQGRDDLLRAFLADASAGTPTKVYLKGRIFTFDAPANITTRTGLYMELKSSQDILLDRSREQYGRGRPAILRIRHFLGSPLPSGRFFRPPRNPAACGRFPAMSASRPSPAAGCPADSRCWGVCRHAGR